MVFEIVWTHRALVDLKKLDRAIQKRITNKLQFLRQDPLHYAEKLEDFRVGTFRLRIGTYRVIFDLDGKRMVIHRVGHRRDIYR